MARQRQQRGPIAGKEDGGECSGDPHEGSHAPLLEPRIRERKPRMKLVGDVDELEALLARRRMQFHEMDHDPLDLLFSMKIVDELQFWDSMLILAHTLDMRGVSGFSAFRDEVVGAIRSLREENLSPRMRRCLEEIASSSPNELARAEARRRLAHAEGR